MKRGLSFVFWAWPILLVVFEGCSRAPQPVPDEPYGSLLEIVAEYGRHADTDLYRYGIPLDLAGRNVFRATLARLNSFEKSRPGSQPDVVAFVRAGCYARLSEFEQASRIYQAVSSGPASGLSVRATSLAVEMDALHGATRNRSTGESLGDWLADLERRGRDLSVLEEEWAGSYEALLARKAREQVEVEMALLLFRNRHVLEQGAERSVEHLHGLIDEHAGSRRIFAHRLLLGEFYLTLARDLVLVRSPEGLDFDVSLCLDLAVQAREQFLLVSQADGFEEKPEGQAMLEAAESFLERIRRASR
ncbi:hypothetical protein HQ520_12835 [bacterium]|nr:hypothetical protein [bacterium]